MKPEEEDELKRRQLQALRDSERMKNAAGTMGGGCCGILVMPLFVLLLIWVVFSIATCARHH